jgi:Anti-sigma-K factor rskA
LTEANATPDVGTALDHEFSRSGPGYGMDETDARVAEALSGRARHYHQRRSDDAATEDPAPSAHRGEILKVTPESFSQALDQLDPGSRALLDLSLHRGMEDREIAELLGSDPDYVSSSREAAIAQIAEDLGLHGDGDEVRSALAEMGEEAWRPRLPEDDEPAAVEATPAVAEAPERPKRSQRRLTLFVLLVVAAVAAAVIAAGSGSKSSTSKNVAAPAPKPAATPKPQATPGAPVAPLSAASHAKGTAHLEGRSLTLTISGLPKPAGTYEVWLYNNEIDAVPVTSFSSGSATVHAKLPVSPAGYRYLDVSLEPADGNPNHSGQSVLRAPLRSLR